MWELTYALEKRVQLPPVDLPGFAGGEVLPTVEIPREPPATARAIRAWWDLGTGPIAHLVRVMEAHGIIVALVPLSDGEIARVDAFSTSRLPRPLVVLTPDRAKDVYRYRFTAAHELGHLVLHGDAAPGDMRQEREADAFAAELLTPRASILPSLPRRADFTALAELQQQWGVSAKSLLYRCREVGILSSSAASRAYQRLNILREQGAFPDEPVTSYPGERPALLVKAFELQSLVEWSDNHTVGEVLAAQGIDHGVACHLVRRGSVATGYGLSMNVLADELAWPMSRLRELLNLADTRPPLRLVT